MHLYTPVISAIAATLQFHKDKSWYKKRLRCTTEQLLGMLDSAISIDKCRNTVV